MKLSESAPKLINALKWLFTGRHLFIWACCVWLVDCHYPARAEIFDGSGESFIDEPIIENDVFQANGMEFSGSYLIFHGYKDPELEIQFRLDYSTSSPACSGLLVKQSELESVYNLEHYKDGKALAHKSYYAPAGGSYDYRVSFQADLQDPRGCDWRLEHRYFGSPLPV